MNEFITKVPAPPQFHFVSIEVLKQCRKGLKKRIKMTDDPEKRFMLKIIKDEIKGLIKSL